MLPPIVAEIADTIGMDGALKLVSVYGGVRLYVPTLDRLNNDSEICRAIGLDAAEKLAIRFGGSGAFDLPRCAAMVRDRRNAEIRTRKEEGETVRSLALAYRMTERQIFNILDAETLQPSINFDIWGISDYD